MRISTAKISIIGFCLKEEKGQKYELKFCYASFITDIFVSYIVENALTSRIQQA